MGTSEFLANVFWEVEEELSLPSWVPTAPVSPLSSRRLPGCCNPTEGQILFGGDDLRRLSTGDWVERGIVLVLEGRRLFQTLSVIDNLKLGAHLPKARASYADLLERVFTLFPVLRDRKDGKCRPVERRWRARCWRPGGSDGAPKMVMIDEASLGLSPILTRSIFELIVTLNQQGTTALLVEQNIWLWL